MTSHEIVARHEVQPTYGLNTYGCLDPIEIGPLEALLDDIKRTYAHIMWLERYIAALPTNDAFANNDAQMTVEQERTRIGRPTVVGSVKWQAEIQRRKQIGTKATRHYPHPAIKLLLEERNHLANVTTKAIAVGVKLDAIDYSRKQADLLVEAMRQFALTSDIDPTDPLIVKRIADSLNSVLETTTKEQT